MSVAYDIMGNKFEPYDLICSVCGYNKHFDIRVVKKITNASVMYYSLSNISDGYNLKYLNNEINGLKIPDSMLNEEYKEKYGALLKTIKKDVATADNT